MASVLEQVEDPEKGPPPAANDGDGYRPGADEPFMNPRQLEYFREKLLAWKDAIHRESAGTLSQLQSESLREADLTDRASSETDWSIELRTRDRQRKLISKIDAALRRIEDGEYFARPAVSAADRNDDRRGAGAPRAQREGLPRGVEKAAGERFCSAKSAPVNALDKDCCSSPARW
jgi:DnaK suppressor protein